LERIMPDLPSGLVIFLFTDIEGSTACREDDRSTMAKAVHRHQLTVLRTAIEVNSGAVQVAFPTALQTVTAAIAAQRAMPPSIPSGDEAVAAVGHAVL
jgi:hypothetical protein